ncbi:hypothetical protein BUALT_Bualt03G0083700 [Buddleja alternifolia]|uniref:Phytocyanin domain-containing protein n=1 Tax=Buddleja alternifolia TaxID=168488 RepID=A0AAV6Y078_9LAMI|nr:hypothetical protein BUALT_Bualt03G0083700 [Buddleja alternifolia]
MAALLKLAAAVFVVVAALSGAGVSAQTHHVVGDDGGWGPAFNITSWLSGRVFRVGDKIWFKNAGMEESIVELKGLEEFLSCNLTNPIRMYTDKGNHVSLEKEGVRYFTSGNPESCKNGLKLPVAVESVDPYPPWGVPPPAWSTPPPAKPSPRFGPPPPVEPFPAFVPPPPPSRPPPHPPSAATYLNKCHLYQLQASIWNSLRNLLMFKLLCIVIFVGYDLCWFHCCDLGDFKPALYWNICKRKAVEAPFREGSSGSFRPIGGKDDHLKGKVAEIEELLAEDRREAYTRGGKVLFAFDGESWDPKWKVSSESSIFEMGAGGTSFKLYKACDAEISSLRKTKEKLDADLADAKGALRDALLRFDEIEARHTTELDAKDKLLVIEKQKFIDLQHEMSNLHAQLREETKKEKEVSFKAGLSKGVDGFLRSEDYEKLVKKHRHDGAKDFKQSTIFQKIMLNKASSDTLSGFTNCKRQFFHLGGIKEGFDLKKLDPCMISEPIPGDDDDDDDEEGEGDAEMYVEFDEFRDLAPTDASDEDDDEAN